MAEAIGCLVTQMLKCDNCNKPATVHLTEIRNGKKIEKHVLHEGDELELAAEVMWLAFQETQGKPPGAALHFMHMSSDDRQRLFARLKEAGATA